MLLNSIIVDFFTDENTKIVKTKAKTKQWTLSTQVLLNLEFLMKFRTMILFSFFLLIFVHYLILKCFEIILWTIWFHQLTSLHEISFVYDRIEWFSNCKKFPRKEFLSRMETKKYTLKYLKWVLVSFWLL